MLSYLKFKELEEELHPELENVLKNSRHVGMPARVVNKIKELTARGQDTGQLGNPSKGSSRIYVRSKDPEKITVGGKQHNINFGMKAVIRNPLDKYLDKQKYGHKSLGHMQNAFENGNRELDKDHRVLFKNNDGTYSHNPHGIFPPLLDHDDKNHNWTKVGHSDDITKDDFQRMTRAPGYEDGISHLDFHNALYHAHDTETGRGHLWDQETTNRMEHISKHPLTKEFINYQRKYGSLPHDWAIHNLGNFRYAGKDHIVARDHGFSDATYDAYADTKKKQYDDIKKRGEADRVSS